MKCFVFETPKALNVSELLYDIIVTDEMIPFIRLDNLSYIILPRAAKILPYFRDYILEENKLSRRVNLLFKDLNILNIVKVDKAHLDFRLKEDIGLNVELYVDKGNSSVLAGVLGLIPRHILFKEYDYLMEMLPYDIRDGGGITFNVITSSNRIVGDLTVTFTLLYTLFNFDKKIRIDGDRYQKEAVEYINYLMGRLREFGNDFYEAIENLKALATIL
jgi:hypothetical protein